MSLDLNQQEVNTGSGNGLVLSGNKPFPEPKLTPIQSHHMTSLDYNELTHRGPVDLRKMGHF